MRQLATMLFIFSAIFELHAEVRWNASIKEYYRNEAIAADVPFQLKTPPRISHMESYPLVVVLKGGLRVPPGRNFPYFRAQPAGHGIWGYRTLAAYDAMQVIAFMKKNYPIDPDRIYLVGSSAGGSGAMHLASCFPDEFAAVIPLIAAGNNYPLVNFSNLPVAFHHGDRDWVSSICNARVQTLRMQALGCPTILKEYPGAGHGIPGSHEPMMTWLLSQKRNSKPSIIRHECESPSLGNSYWLQIKEFNNPHRPAVINAKLNSELVSINPSNIASFSLSIEQLAGVKSVQIGEDRLPVSHHYQYRQGHWQTAESFPVTPVRSYEAGGAANLYQGEPLLIVYGTNSDNTQKLRMAALKLAKYGGPDYSPMRQTRFPVIADKNLTIQQQTRCNLILIGNPDENSITQSLWSGLPVSIKNNSLIIRDRTPLKMSNKILGLLHPHPRHPQRLIYLLAPFTDISGLTSFANNIQKFLPGSDGFDRISQPDLVVQNLDHHVCRQMQFGKDWKFCNHSDANILMPSQFADRTHLAIACMKRMVNKSDSNFALWWGPTDKGMWGTDFNYLMNFDTAFYSLADFHTQHRIHETTLGTVSGAELKDIWNRWGKQRELLCYPKLELDAIDDNTQYLINVPMDLYIKLGQRKKNLGKPRPGPRFTTEELIPLIFLK